MNTVCAHVCPWFLSDSKSSPYGVLGGLNRPSFGMPGLGRVGSVTGECGALISAGGGASVERSPFKRLSRMAGLGSIHLLPRHVTNGKENRRNQRGPLIEI